VYSIDAYWSGGREPIENSRKKGKRTVAPDHGDASSAGTITLVSGSHDQAITIWEVQKSINGRQELVAKVMERLEFCSSGLVAHTLHKS
jgi:hypothetical protein